MIFPKEAAPGFVLALIIAVLSYLMSLLHPTFDALVISIIFGMLVSNMMIDRKTIEKGIDLAIGIFLPLGIGLYGMQLHVGTVDPKLWPAVVAVFVFYFLITYFISTGFGLGRDVAFLLSGGLSVCGASAIVVLAPIIAARKEDTSISIISVMTVGLTCMLIYNFLPGMMGLSPGKFAFLAGTTLPMFGQVKVAAATMGPECLNQATNYKLLRISLLVALAVYALVVSKKKKFRFPLFLVAFFVLAAVVNLTDRLNALRTSAEILSKYSLSAALAAIGLSVDFDSITEKGAGPLIAAALSIGILVMLVYLVMNVVS